LRCWRRRLLLAALVGASLLLAHLPQAFDSQRLTQAAVALGPRAVAGARSLVELIARGSRAAEDSKVRATNQFFNDAVAFVDDIDNWGQVDYWASPLETLGRGQGDCEDYAIAKYFSLLAVGMPVARLRLVYVRAQLDDGPAQAHMVLAYYPGAGGETLILDNLVDEVLPASRRSDLVPVFSFNSDGLWQGVGTVGAGDPLLRLTRWRELLAKVRAEGFL
jgi:predicted transglutaminase-like cysteine proteinase